MLSFEEIEDCFPNGAVSLPDGWTGVTAQWLHDFAHAVTAKEREACAKVCDEYAEGSRQNMADVCAEEIRKRSNTQAKPTREAGSA